MFCEKPYGLPAGPARGRFRPFLGYWQGTADFRDSDDLIALCRAGAADPEHYSNHTGYSWSLPGNRNTEYTHDAGINSSIPDCGHALGEIGGSFAARSYHPGGVNAAYVDGHVAFESESIDLAVWREPGTRDRSSGNP